MQRAWVTSEAYEAAVAAIVKVRHAQGISQRELALRLDKPRSFVSKYENRERRLDIIEFIVVSKALGVTPEDLLAAVSANLPSQIVI